MDHIFLTIASEALEVGTNVSQTAISGISAIRTDDQGNTTVTFSDNLRKSGIALEVSLRNLGTSLFTDRDERVVIVVDNMMTQRLYDQCNKGKDIFAGRTWVDLHNLTWPFVYAGELEGRSIQKIAQYFGVSLPANPTSVEVTTAMARVYWAIMNRYELSQKVEGGLRKIGGNALNKAFQFLNNK